MGTVATWHDIVRSVEEMGKAVFGVAHVAYLIAILVEKPTEVLIRMCCELNNEMRDNKEKHIKNER